MYYITCEIFNIQDNANNSDWEGISCNGLHCRKSMKWKLLVQYACA